MYLLVLTIHNYIHNLHNYMMNKKHQVYIFYFYNGDVSQIYYFICIQGDPLQMVELLHNKKIFSNGQKKSPLLHIDQNMTQFIILKKIFFVPFKKVEFLFAFVAKQSFVEQNGAHFWHISSKTSWLAGIGLNLFVTHKIWNPDDLENFRFFLDHPDSGFYGS